MQSFSLQKVNVENLKYWKNKMQLTKNKKRKTFVRTRGCLKPKTWVKQLEKYCMKPFC